MLGSAVLIFSGWVALTLAGKWLVPVLADIVGVFAALETIGIRRL